MRQEINPQECEQLLKKLVQTNTTQPNGHEAMLVDFIESRYQSKSVELFRIDHQPDRASLIVKLQGKEDREAIAFVGHLDTVPFDGLSQWRVNPLAGEVRKGRLTGRGAADMKGGVAAMLLTLDRLLEQETPPKRTIFFCFTADEEKNGLGAMALADHPAMADVGALIVCEPTQGDLGICEKGALWVKVITEGVSAHASRPELGCNALEGLLTFLTAARTVVETPGKHPYLGRNTLSITTLQSGISQNIIPSTAEATLDIRTLPGVSHQALLAAFQELAKVQQKSLPSLRLKIETLNNRPALETDAAAPLVRQILAFGRQSEMPLNLRGLFFYTDASQIVPKLKIPFVILGPGDDRQAHVVNEAIELSSVSAFAELYFRICTAD